MITREFILQFLKLVANKTPEAAMTELSGMADTPMKNAFSDMFISLMQYKANGYDSRVIGKALTHGAPGKSFDILLNHTHVTGA